MLGETKRAGRHKAHTLVEILSVVAVVGLVAGLVTMMITDALDDSEEDEARRNARQIVHIFDAGVAAGLEAFTRDDSGDVLTKTEVVGRVSSGRVVPGGPLAGVYLGVAMSESERERVLRFLDWDSASLKLSFDPSGVD